MPSQNHQYAMGSVGRVGLQSAGSGYEDGSTDIKNSPDSEQTSIHTLCTSNGSPYLNFQTRIM